MRVSLCSYKANELIKISSRRPFSPCGDHEMEYDEIIQMGEPVVDYFIEEFNKSKYLKTFLS